MAFPTAAVPAANPYGLPAAGGAAPMAGFPAGFPGAMGFPATADPVISVPAMGANPAMPGALPMLSDPAALPGMGGALAGPALPPGLLPADINTMIAAPPPRARPAAPPAPPIPTGATFKPQWDELKDFSEKEVIVSAYDRLGCLVIMFCFLTIYYCHTAHMEACVKHGCVSWRHMNSSSGRRYKPRQLDVIYVHVLC
jgi:hypothetical protein